MILETKGLTKRFGGLVAVNEVTLGIEKGEIRAIIGPNGSGKSTLLNVLSGVYKPSGGTQLLRAFPSEAKCLAASQKPELVVLSRTPVSSPHSLCWTT